MKINLPFCFFCFLMGGWARAFGSVVLDGPYEFALVVAPFVGFILGYMTKGGLEND